MDRKHSFAPVVGRRPRAVILGSLPGEASLELGQYYGHPRNTFWELVGAALEEDLRALPYRRRLSRLKAHGIALWDVVESAHRLGSLDSAIHNERHNPVLSLIARTGVRVVFFNGRKAADAFFRSCSAIPPGIRFATLPSSSPANASIPWKNKVAAWSILASAII